jgi:hypothetical protein
MKITKLNTLGYIVACLIAPVMQIIVHMLSWVDDMIYEMRVAIRELQIFYNNEQEKARKQERRDRIKKKLLAEMEE